MEKKKGYCDNKIRKILSRFQTSPCVNCGGDGTFNCKDCDGNDIIYYLRYADYQELKKLLGEKQDELKEMIKWKRK